MATKSSPRPRPGAIHTCRGCAARQPGIQGAAARLDQESSRRGAPKHPRRKEGRLRCVLMRPPTGYRSADTPVSSATNRPQLFRLCCDGSKTAASSPTSAGGCASVLSGCCSCCAALQRIAGCCCCWAGCQGPSAAGRPASGAGALSIAARRGAALDRCTFCALNMLEVMQCCIVATRRQARSGVLSWSGRARHATPINRR